MPLTNTTRDYGTITKTFHWLTALLILTALPLGFLAQQAPMETADQITQKVLLFSLHKTVGISAFFVGLLRIFWSLTQMRPGLLNGEHRFEAWAAHTVHWLLYGAMVLVPLTGWIHHAATAGFAPILWPFGQSLPLVPKSEALASLTSGLHFVFMLVLVGSILAHVAGALKHAIVDRDQTLQRMLPGSHNAPDAPQEPTNRKAILAAVVIWAAALGGGIVTGQFAGQHEASTPLPSLSKTASDWQVSNGTLSATVHQFGSDVTGGFETWQAVITFDETATGGAHGNVDVQIAIGSLTLGSVTDQALGPDFFDQTQFPTATFNADILGTDTGYVARGTLSLKGAEVPVDLPFTLDLQGDTAEMRGRVTLDRRDFAIGNSMPDESSLAFKVIVDVSLTATRAP